MTSPFIPPDLLPHLMRQTLGGRNGATRSPLSLTLPKPYAKWQLMLMNAKLRLAVFPMGTKVGKSLGGSGRVATFSYSAPAEQDALFRIIAPTYPLSGITYRYLNRLLPPKLPPQKTLSHAQQYAAARAWERFAPERSDSGLWMKWNHNGARVQCVHGQDPEVTIEGERVHGNVYDEASKMRSQVYASGLSTTSQTGGWNVLYSTPRGKNYFFQLYMECREHMAWAERTGGTLEMYAETARTIDSPYVDQRVIEQARRTLPDRLFRQLYLAEFLDDGTVFVGYRDCVEGTLVVTEGKVEAWQREDAGELTVVIGADWAKRQDYCVLYAIDVASKRPRCAGFRRMHGVSYLEAVKELARFGKRFKEVIVAKHDRTGIGDVIEELLSNLSFPIEGVVFSNQSKASMVDAWSVALATKAVELPNWQPLISEHDYYDVKTNPLGKPVYGAIPGQHDDIVTACFLAWSAYMETRDIDFEVLDLDDLSGAKAALVDPDSIEGLYHELIGDGGEEDDESEFNF
jgi:Terminase RNaseH-like domain